MSDHGPYSDSSNLVTTTSQMLGRHGTYGGLVR